MELEASVKNNVPVLKIKGDVDLYSSPQVRKKILTLLSKASKNLIVDLKEVTYMDSSGVATLVEALQLTNRKNGKLRLCNLGPTICDVFELSRLDKVFDIFQDEETALQDI